MPTGYTADVGDGKVQDFKTFAWTCARAFGALVMLRDEPLSAEVPEDLKPSDHHAKALEEATARLTRLKAMTPAEIAEATGTANAKSQADRRDAQNKSDAIKYRYEDMLAKVRAWNPPTPDHQGMRKFMEEQLVDSIKFDCGIYEDAYKRYTPEEWHLKQIESAAWDVGYHLRENEREIARTNERNKWIADLRTSLDTPSPEVRK